MEEPEKPLPGNRRPTIMEEPEKPLPENRRPTIMEEPEKPLPGNHRLTVMEEPEKPLPGNRRPTVMEEPEKPLPENSTAVMEEPEKVLPENSTAVTLRIADVTIDCEKAVLASNSDYFKAMFDSNMMESTSDCISLEQVDPQTMRLIVDFMVTGRLSLTHDNVQMVTEAACMYQVSRVTELCCEMMENSLGDENCLAIMTLTDTFALNQLFCKAKRHCLWNFMVVVHTPNFVDVDIRILNQILSDRKVIVRSEMDIYDAIDRWVSQDASSRERHLKELLPLIRVEDLTDQELFILKQKKFVREHHHIFENSATTGRVSEKYRRVPQCLWSIGGQVDDYDGLYESDEESEPELLPKVLVLNDLDMTFEPVSDDLDHPSIQHETGYSICVLGKDVYVSGGMTSLGPGLPRNTCRNTWLHDIWRFDTFTRKWESVTQLLSPRRHHTTISQGDSLYILGGFGKYRIKLYTCEEFNTKTGQWKDLPPLPEEAFLLAACAPTRDRLYALKAQAYYHDLGSSHWTRVDAGVYTVTHLVPSSAIAYQNRVYIVSRYHKDLLCFDPCSQTVTTVGQFKHSESVSNAVLYQDRVCRFSFPFYAVMEWYDLTRQEFRSKRVNGISVLDFHLVTIPQMLDVP